MKFKLTALLLVISSSTASAMSNAEICSLRGKFVETAAIMRDAGKTEAQALAEFKKAFKSAFKKEAPNSMTDYVGGVYAGKQYKPSELRKLAEALCLNELGQ